MQTKMISRLKIYVKPGVTAFLVTLVAGISGCGEEAVKKPAEPTNTAPVITETEVFAAQKGKLSSVLQVPGELVAFQQVDLYAKENSFVKKLLVDVGSEVKQGQLLATLEAPELASQLAASLSTLKSREAVYEASNASYNRLLATSETPGTISPNDLEQALAKKNADFALLQAAKATYRQMQEMQGYLQIRAPFSGIITARNVNAGAYVGPSGKGSEMPMFSLKEQTKLRLVISVPEYYTAYLSESNPVSFTVKGLPNEKFTAKVNRLAGAIDNRLHAERIEMDVVNAGKKLLPGMVAEVVLPLPAQDSSLIVPKSALVNSTEKVFVIRVANNKAEWVDVKAGRENNGKVEIFGEVNAGDLLVKTASDEVRDGSDLSKIKTVEISDSTVKH